MAELVEPERGHTHAHRRLHSDTVYADSISTPLAHRVHTPLVLDTNVRVDVIAETDSDPGLATDVEQGALGGGNAARVASPLELDLIARDSVSGNHVPLGMLVFEMPAVVVQRATVLPVLLQPAWVQTFQTDVHVWSTPFRAAEDLGVAGDAWTTYRVIAPQVGGRIGVELPGAQGVAWIDARGVVPTGRR